MSFILYILLWLGVIQTGNTYSENSINELQSTYSSQIQTISNDPTLSQHVNQTYGNTQVLSSDKQFTIGVTGDR